MSESRSNKAPSSRRRFLQLAAGAGIASTALVARVSGGAAGAGNDEEVAGSLADERILLEFDRQMRTRVSRAGSSPNTAWTEAEVLELADGVSLARFEVQERTHSPIDGPYGKGTRLRLVGKTDRVEKTLEVDLLTRYPGMAVYHVAYRNISPTPINLRRWTQTALRLPTTPAVGQQEGAGSPDFWSFCGSTHEDRRDWVQPVRAGFSQDNYMGMTASDYGGGTPIVDVWRRDYGIAVGHLNPTPLLVSLPLRHSGSGADVAITGELKRTLGPGERFEVPETFAAVHTGDYFVVLDAYRQMMAQRGLASPPAPAGAYESIWCAWGYERDCTLKLIEDTLPKVQELGLRWAVIDDGWQSNVGDWKLDPAKYPGGDADMKALVRNIQSRGLKPRLWWAPLAVAPGSDVLHDQTDMLLLDKDGAAQNVSWWNSFYLCPAYHKTVSYTLNLVRRFLGDWGYAGLKIDGQHLNAVAPCYNPAHHHADPLESTRKLQDFFQAIYQTALQINPQAVVELCPCGTAYSFFNLRSLNQAPASDPESSWQVRHKGKSLKALMGRSAAFAGDHVELSDGGDDFASTVGVGAIISTKFTWPRDPKPKDSFLLTPERERLWRKWIALYNEHLLPQGSYRGELYDIGFDKPEAHVVEKSGRFYYAFYAPSFNGSVQLRGLANKRYRVKDYFNERPLGEVTRQRDRVQVAFERFMMLEAVPV